MSQTDADHFARAVEILAMAKGLRVQNPQLNKAAKKLTSKDGYNGAHTAAVGWGGRLLPRLLTFIS